PVAPPAKSSKITQVIIAISASALNPAESEIIGYQAFLPKPVSEKQLLNLLQQYLQLSWIYEAIEKFNLFYATQQNTTTQTLIAPPLEEMAILYELAMLGSIKKIVQRASYLEQLEEQYAPLAAKLKELAGSFQEKKIVDLVKQHLLEK
ncbi:MAG: hypothetical protein AAF652_08160, partial [Cyanobacteria bacterium P01_C01_bin.72]